LFLPAAIALSWAAPAFAQESVSERFNLDRLQLTSLGLSAGPVWIARAEPTQAYAISADYGEITRNWHVLLTVTFWRTHFDESATSELADAVRGITIDPSGDDTVRVGKVRISDVAFEIDGRWAPLRNTAIRPFLGAALGAHVMNAENQYISGTFVEDALDMIASGITLLAGAETAPLGGVAFGIQGRYTLISNTRFFTLRAGGRYIFPQARPRE
jgi:opacity protein-like surface antigen